MTEAGAKMSAIAKASKPETEAPAEEARIQSEEENRKDVPMIVYRQHFVDSNGQPGVREHGPMPVEEWPAYEREHKL